MTTTMYQQVLAMVVGSPLPLVVLQKTYRQHCKVLPILTLLAMKGTGNTTLTSGNVLVGNGTSAVQTTKAAPSGDFVGTTDTQSLTNMV